jgi:hypothetical protein
MRRTIGSVPRTTLYVLLLAGCADSEGGSGFSATQGTEGATATDGKTSSSGTTGAMSSTGGTSSAGTTTNMTSSVSAGTGEPGSSTGVMSTSGAMDTGETEGTSTTGSTGEAETTAASTAASTGEDTAGALSFAADIWPIFDDKCSCHQDANGAGKLRLAMEDAYTNMINMPSDQVPMMMLVKPGSSADSYLWHKLNNTQKDVGGKGKKMPPGGLLKMPQLDLIQQWIDGGAKP